jgi:molybdopterin-guanine dinucleotide biosynthesis protein A
MIEGTMRTDVTGVLLAGGKSRRMGEDKRYLLVGQETLLDRGLRILRSVFRDVLVVIAQDSPSLENPSVRVLRDLVPDCGSLGGLYTGLKTAATPSVFVVACDMPFLDPAVIATFTALAGTADIVMAKLAGPLHPMHAVYSKACLPIVERMIKARELKIQQMVEHPSLTVRYVTEADLTAVDPDGQSFHNVNTPDDLAAARAVLANRQISG